MKPDLPDAYIARGGSYHMMGQHEKGIADRTEAIRLSPLLADAWYARGSAYFLMGDFAKAVVDLKEAARLNPSDIRVAGVLAKAEAKLREAAQPVAATPAPAAAAAAPPPVQAQAPPAAKPQPAITAAEVEQHHRKGRELLQKGQYRAAIDELTEALAAKPDHVLALNARGYAYYLLRDYKNAMQDLDRAIELNPRYANAYRNRSAARKAMGDAKGAGEDLNRAQQLEK
jgi:tetratricopeptide (TPR) repeat protein